MKVGIITFHHTPNYGATLQTYALSKILKCWGHDVEIIDYQPKKIVEFYRRECIIIDKKMQINRRAIDNLIKAFKMRFFLLYRMKLSPQKCSERAELKNLAQRYDIIIAGSDQIWCLDAYRGFDPSFFLDFVDGRITTKISYAASFGETTQLGKQKELICQLINQFDAVSVRDSNSLELIKEECNKEATKVLDPTLLIEYYNILSVPKSKENYLLMYTQKGLTLEQKNFIKLISKIKNLSIISIGKYNDIATKNVIGISPEKWLGYFSQASYIITNTYHGTIFSLVFKKPFNVFYNNKKSNKTGDLLKSLDLENRIISESNFSNPVDNNFFNIDYTLVCQKLEENILHSKSYLLRAIEKTK
jgi:polysaccharide pyruvyl transferase WcaK-like protein